jgi:DNA-binding LacI/PurR family transcriptional regulator
MKLYKELERGQGKTEPLYQQIKRQLAKHIDTGSVAKGQRFPSISKMVENWDVDYQTVNLALELLEKEGLIKCEEGRGKGPVVMADSGTKYTAMFLRWSHDDFVMSITEGIRKFAEEKGMPFSMADVSDSKEAFLTALSHPMAGVNGLILWPPDTIEFRRACLQALDRGVKIVFVDLKLEGLPVSSVSVDHIGGAHQATAHLIRKHHNPVYCFGLTPKSSVQARYQGWALAMNQNGFREHTGLVYETTEAAIERGDFYRRSLRAHTEAASSLIARNKNGTLSIFCCTGFAAQGIYAAAKKMGLTIGQDIFVAGFGDDPACWKLPVPLTSVAQNNEQVGYEAANTLLLEMSGASKHPMTRMLPAKLRIRQSSVGD